MEQEIWPEAIEVISKNIVRVRTDQGLVEVTRAELEQYVAVEARRLSGLRSLAGVSGDWRMIDAIAEDVAFVFNK